MRRTLAVIAAIALVSFQAAAQGVASPSDMRQVIDKIMDRVGAGDVEAGLKLLKPHTIIPEAEFDAMMGQAKLQLPAMGQRFGGKQGYEFLREDKAGTSLIRYTYIDKFDKHAMRWIFYTYKAKGGWVVNTFRFDDQLPSLFP